MYDNSEVTEINVIKPSRRVENVHLVEAKMVPTRAGDDEANTLMFKFVQAGTKGVLEHREFEPVAREGKTEQALKTQISLTVSRIKHIVNRFISEEESNKIKGANWKEYCKNIIAALGNKDDYKKKKLIMKVVLNENKGKYYSALPGVPPFLSSVEYPKVDHNNPNDLFPTNPAYDKYEIPTFNPANSGGGSPGEQEGNDDLPF